MGPDTASTFANDAGSGESNVRINLASSTPTANDRSMKSNRIASIAAINNTVTKRQNDNKADTSTSVIKGPRSAATALNFNTKTLSDDDFKRFGKTGQTISGASGTYRYIDTNVKVMTGLGDSLSIPIRIIQKE